MKNTININGIDLIIYVFNIIIYLIFDGTLILPLNKLNLNIFFYYYFLQMFLIV